MKRLGRTIRGLTTPQPNGRVGIIEAVDTSTGRVAVSFGGEAVTGVTYVTSYSPAVGHRCLVSQGPTGLVVMGRLSGEVSPLTEATMHVTPEPEGIAPMRAVRLKPFQYECIASRLPEGATVTSMRLVVRKSTTQPHRTDVSSPVIYAATLSGDPYPDFGPWRAGVVSRDRANFIIPQAWVAAILSRDVTGVAIDTEGHRPHISFTNEAIDVNYTQSGGEGSSVAVASDYPPPLNEPESGVDDNAS